MRKTKILFLYSLAILLVIAGCSSKSSNEPETIVYGGSSWLAHIPAYIGVEKGFFEEEGLNVEFKSFSTSSERMTSLASGDVVFASTGSISALSLMAAGDKSFSIVGSPDIYVGQEGLVVSDDISSFEDLKGTKIGVPFSSSSHVMLLDLFEKHGLEPGKDVEVLNMDGPDMVSSFTTGEIDGGAIWVPSFGKLQEVEGSRVLAKDTDTTIYEEYEFNGGPDVLVVQTEFLENHPETAQKLLRAYFNAIKWIKDNPKEAAEVFVELAGTSVEEQKEIISTIEWLDETDQVDKLGENGDLKNTLTFLSDFLYKNKLTNKEVDDVKEWINTDVIPE